MYSISTRMVVNRNSGISAGGGVVARLEKQKKATRKGGLTALKLKKLRSCRHSGTLFALPQVFLDGNYLEFVDAAVAFALLAYDR
jgi:hypothetical protein